MTTSYYPSIRPVKSNNRAPLSTSRREVGHKFGKGLFTYVPTSKVMTPTTSSDEAAYAAQQAAERDELIEARRQAIADFNSHLEERAEHSRYMDAMAAGIVG